MGYPNLKCKWRSGLKGNGKKKKVCMWSRSVKMTSLPRCALASKVI